ncbi:MAG TPA: GNAT family N-acetyltransferase [Polyangiaceae bacterium]
MIVPPKVIESKRVLLRMPERSDASYIFDAYAHDLEVLQFMPFRPHANVQVSARFIGRCLALWENGMAWTWVLVSRDDPNPAGMLEARVQSHSMEIGYVLATQYWGRGLMTEAVQAVLNWASNEAYFYRIWATCDTANYRSVRLLERVGMQHEGVLRRWRVFPNISEEPRDCHCYSKVR